MTKKWLQRSTVLFIAFLLSFTMNTSSMNVSAAGDFTQGVDVSGNNVTLWFKSKVDTTWVDVHYKVNSGVQQNLRMTYNAGAGRYEQFVDTAAGAVIEYFFTYNNGTPAYDTTTFTYLGAGQTAPTNPTDPTDPTDPTGDSIYSIPASSIPNPKGGGVSLKVMNGTGGAYADDQIYWGVIGKNPANGQWSYLNLSGQLVPISTALNDAPGHITKNGANYANIYHKISDTPWVNLPKITAGRLFLSVGSPLYIKTFDDGFAGPDLNNPTDPNLDVYFDFAEFTVDDAGYHGNTTRVDQFGFPIQHRLVNKAGNYDRTVGEFEAETRSGLFAKYRNEVPAEFKSLGTLQAPYRIVSPMIGPFKPGGAYENYFAGYSNISTRDILLGIGGASDPQVCAALNRHVFTASDWNDVSQYYKAAPANYYAKFWHDHSIDGLAYGFAYDDVNGQAAYLEVGDPKGVIVRVGW